jgi:hypothetical protein
MKKSLVFLLVAALSSFAGPAGAQPDPLQFVVIYVEFMWSSSDAHVSAQHTLDFRTDIQPFIGAPYDERLYHLANR